MAAVLHLISDQQRHRLPLEEALVEGALGGAAVLQVRQKKAPAADTYALVQRLIDALAKIQSSASVMVNDRLDVAIAAGAAGVHLAARSMPLEAALRLRALAGWRGLVGCSVHSLEDAEDAQRCGADYAVFGHVFATGSHAGLPPKGLDALARVVERVSIPVVAIGGITADNVGAVLETRCSGVAVIGAVLESACPRSAARAIVERIACSGSVPRVLFPTVQGGGVS